MDYSLYGVLLLIWSTGYKHGFNSTLIVYIYIYILLVYCVIFRIPSVGTITVHRFAPADGTL